MFKQTVTNKGIDFELKFSLRRQSQVRNFKRLLTTSPADAIRYISSFKGLGKQSPINWLTNTRRYEGMKLDPLLGKHKDWMLTHNRELYDARTCHGPNERLYLGKWIGVEVECLIPLDAVPRDTVEKFLANYVRNCPECDREVTGTECDDCEMSLSDPEDDPHMWVPMLAKYTSSKKIKRLSVKNDGSIDCEYGSIPVEFTIVFPEHDKTELVKLCELLKELRAEVNTTCGLHVHLDQRDLLTQRYSSEEISKILNRRADRLDWCLPFLTKMVPRSRSSNSYCRLTKNTTDDDSGERYHAVNRVSWNKYKTLEVRLHSGTCNFEKINNWIDLLLLISRSTEINCKIGSFEDFIQLVNVPEKLIEFYFKRIEKFKSEVAQDEAQRDFNEFIPANAVIRNVQFNPSTFNYNIDFSSLDELSHNGGAINARNLFGNITLNSSITVSEDDVSESEAS